MINMYDYKDIRNFYFENEIGKRVDCQNINGGLFLYNVTGLGYEKNIEYQQVGNSFIKDDEKIVQNRITGELEFYNMTYDEYKTFINFILNSISLRLIYIPKTSKRVEYYRDVDMCKIDKSEEDDYNVLTSPIEINCKSLWYEENIATYNIVPEDDEVRWDFEWDSTFEDYNSQSIEYKNEGHVEAPILLEIEGPASNPVIEIYIDNKLYQRVTLKTQIQAYEKILYNSKENEFRIQKVHTDGTTESMFNLDVLDFPNEDPVIRLPKNYDCEIRIKADDVIQKAKLTILPQYFAV